MSAASTALAPRTRALLIGALGVCALAGGWMTMPDGSLVGPVTDPTQVMVDAVRWVQAAGPLGDVLFVLLYGVQTVLLVPASWSHAAAGFVYGPVAGWLMASACATVFSSVNFWLGRTLLRGWVERRLANHPRMSALDRQIEAKGAWIVLLLRLPPISPFNPMSYAFGATRVRFRDFLLGTWAGSVLPITLFTQIGANLSDMAAFFNGDAGAGPGWLQAVGIAVTLAVTVLVTRYARQALDQIHADELAEATAPA